MHTENVTEPGNKVTDWLGDADDWGDEDVNWWGWGKGGNPGGAPVFKKKLEQCTSVRLTV